MTTQIISRVSGPVTYAFPLALKFHRIRGDPEVAVEFWPDQNILVRAPGEVRLRRDDDEVELLVIL